MKAGPPLKTTLDIDGRLLEGCSSVVPIDDASPSKSSDLLQRTRTIDEQEGANQFKMHMDELIGKSCDDLRRSLECLYHEYLSFEQAPTTKPHPPGDFAKVETKADAAKPQTSGDCTKVEIKAEPKDVNGSVTSVRAEDSGVLRTSKSMPHQDSSFEDHLEHDKAALVVKALKNAEAVHAKQGAKRKRGEKPKHAMWWDPIFEMHWRDVFLEPSMGVMVLLNMVFMGVGMDADPNSIVPLLVEVLFCVFFSFEFVLKLVADGCKTHFLGDQARFNWCNAFLVLFDVLGILLSFDRAVESTLQPDGAPSASLLRAVRIMRLARVLRMLRWAIFDDLCAMMQGVMAGMPTLLWSMVLFFCPIYVFALLFREALGRGRADKVTEMFDSVPRSIYTTFRCSFGDCSHPSGVPIFEYVQDHYGGVWSLIYCVFVFFITIGLFNVISAIFVEATMKSAAALDLKTKQDRLQSTDLWSVQVHHLIQRLVRRYPPAPNLLFACSWEEHMVEPVIERVHKARLDRDHSRRSRGLGDMPEDEWNERFCVMDNNGTPLPPEFVLALNEGNAHPAIPQKFFPITANLHAPKAFQTFSDEELEALEECAVPLSEEFAGISKLEYAASTIDTWVKDPLVSYALDELDIDPQDHDKLSDILDPQNDGTVPVTDLIDGIRRLRGFPRRSDIVCIDLMIRESQLAMHEHKAGIESVQEGTQELQSQVEELKDSLRRIESALKPDKAT